jgi:hypothetical protein
VTANRYGRMNTANNCLLYTVLSYMLADIIFMFSRYFIFVDSIWAHDLCLVADAIQIGIYSLIKIDLISHEYMILN